MAIRMRIAVNGTLHIVEAPSVTFEQIAALAGIADARSVTYQGAHGDVREGELRPLESVTIRNATVFLVTGPEVQHGDVGSD